MTPHLASASMKLLARVEPERAHQLGLAGLRLGLAGRAAPADPILASRVLGMELASPIGLAAGFDKNAVAVRPLLALGFGFVEAGTVTPLAQAGNPRPRLFRLAEDGAVINRMGFNGQGAAAVLGRVARLPAGLPLGVNLGINKTGADPVRDYAALARQFAPHARYLVVNVSSPNTPGLRDLQAEHLLADILAAIRAAVPAPAPPVLVKLAPDLAAAALPGVIETCVAGGAAGLVISNTTIARPAGLAGEAARQVGGLSGAPLFAPATAMLARAWLIGAGRLVLIGAGGIATPEQALDKLRAGASLLQLYTAFAYGGPALIGRLNAGLAGLLRERGATCVADLVGTDAARWAGAYG